MRFLKRINVVDISLARVVSWSLWPCLVISIRRRNGCWSQAFPWCKSVSVQSAVSLNTAGINQQESFLDQKSKPLFPDSTLPKSSLFTFSRGLFGCPWLPATFAVCFCGVSAVSALTPHTAPPKQHPALCVCIQPPPLPLPMKSSVTQLSS